MHPPAAYSQQGERHQQQPERGKGNDNKTEDPVVRVNKGGQTPGGHWRGGDQHIDKKNVQNCCRLARPLKLKVSSSRSNTPVHRSLLLSLKIE